MTDRTLTCRSEVIAREHLLETCCGPEGGSALSINLPHTRLMFYLIMLRAHFGKAFLNFIRH